MSEEKIMKKKCVKERKLQRGGFKRVGRRQRAMINKSDTEEEKEW